MKPSGRKWSGFAKTLFFLVALLLVATGLCGVTNSLTAKYGSLFHYPPTPLRNFLSWSGLIEMWTMVFASIAIVLVSIAWLVTAVYRSISKPHIDQTPSGSDVEGEIEKKDRP